MVYPATLLSLRTAPCRHPPQINVGDAAVLIRNEEKASPPRLAQAAQGMVAAIVAPTSELLRAGSRACRERQCRLGPGADPKLLGIVTHSNVLQAFPADINPFAVNAAESMAAIERGADSLKVTAGDLMTRDPLTVPPEAPLEQAASLMRGHKIGALPVVNKHVLVGIITERDYARKIVLMDRSSRDTPVHDIMSTEVRYVDPHQTTDECMAVMTQHRIRYLPVITAGQVIGMVSIGDLIKNQIAEQELTIRQLEHYIHGNGFLAGRNGAQAQSAQM